MKRITTRMIVTLEQCMNQLIILNYTMAPVAQYKISDGHSDKEFDDFKNISGNFTELSERKDLTFVKEHLRSRNYVFHSDAKTSQKLSDDDIDYLRFLNDSIIGPSVWSRYKDGKNARTSHETLLKIVLGLRLNEEEARYYLALTGSGFAPATDLLDRIILSYIRLDYLGDINASDIADTVSSLLQFYAKEMNDERLRKKLSSFYDL